MNATIRAGITRLDHSPSSFGWLLLAFCGATPEEFDAARMAVSGLPQRERQWIAPARVWKVRASALVRLAHCWPALFEALQELGVSGEYGGYGRRYDAPPPSLAPGREIAAAFSLLQLAPGAPVGLVEAARRWWAKELHPDRAGGDADAMKKINAAADVAERFAREHQHRAA
jgi:hypothetical protein